MVPWLNTLNILKRVLTNHDDSSLFGASSDSDPFALFPSPSAFAKVRGEWTLPLESFENRCRLSRVAIGVSSIKQNID